MQAANVNAPLYSAMTSVIVQVADSVTESSSGIFIMETPQTSGTGPLPAAQWRTDLGQAALCPRPCFPLLSTPLLTTLCSLLFLCSSVSGRPSLCPHCVPYSDEAARADVSLISSLHVVKLWRLCPLTLDSDDFYWVPFIKTRSSERPKSQHFWVLCICTMAYLSAALAAWKQRIKE